MREKKMGMRAALTRLLGIVTVACTLVAAPGVASAATTADIPSNVKIAQTESTNPNVADTVTLKAGEDYVVGGEIKINHYVVKGGTEQDPTRIYLTENASVGHWPGSIKDKRTSGYDELFVLDGGYIEFIGTNGNGRTPVYCNGKSFLSDNAGRRDGYADGADKNRVYNSLNLKVSGIKLMAADSGVSKRAIALYGTMFDGETATFDNVEVSNWKCTRNYASYGGGGSQYGNDKTKYEASPAPVTILSSASGAKILDVTFSNCEFTENRDDCAGALSVVGRGCKPKVVFDNCTFKNNHQESIWCKELDVQDKNEHTHAGNIVVNNADVTLNGCTITSTQEAANYTQDMVMTSAIAVAKGSACTLNNTKIYDTYAEGTYYHADANTRRNTVYARGTVTLAGNTTITTNGDEGARGLAFDEPGYYYSGSKLNIAESFTGKVQLSLKDNQLGAHKGAQLPLGTCGIDESDLRSRVTTDDPSVGIGKTDDGYVYASRLPHEHVWLVEKAANSSCQLKVTCSGKMRPSDCNYKNGYAVELGIDGATVSEGKLGIPYSGSEVAPTLTMSNKSGYARDDIVSTGSVHIFESRYYKLTKWGDSKGEALEKVPTDAGIYRIESKVRVDGQDDALTLTREFQIKPLDLRDVSGITFEFNNGGEDTKINGETVRAYPWTGKTITPSFSVKVYNYDAQSWSYFVKDGDYEIDNDPTYSTVSAVDPPSSNSYYPYYLVYIKGMGNYTGSTFARWTITGTQFENVTAKGFEGVYDGQPHGVNISVEKAPADMTIEYNVDGSDEWTTAAPSYTDVQRDDGDEVCSVTVNYRITAKDYVTKRGSVKIEITPASQPVPWRYIASAGTGVKVKDESAHFLNDGSLSNLNETYEWKKFGAKRWKSVPAGETSIDHLSAEKYEVRFKEDNNHYASSANVFTIVEGPCASKDGTWLNTKGADGTHWQVCRCKEKINEGKHDFCWEEVTAPTSEKPGLKQYQCSTCGYVLLKEEIPPACIGGYVGVYDGNEHAVSVDLKDGATAQFSIDGGATWKTDTPTIKNVGKTTVDYKVTTPGASDIEGQVTLEVTPYPITVAPATASKIYGDPDPDFTYKVTAGSLMEGDTLSGITYKRDEGEKVLTGKTYKVTASQEEGANANYDITFEAGEFTITRRTIDVTWNVGQYVYNGQEQGPTAEITNLVNGDDVSLKVTEAAKVNAGTYTAKVTGLVGEDKVLANYRRPSGIECTYAIAKAKRDSAPNVKVAAETVSGKHDGKIEGVDTSMMLGKPGKQMMFIKTSDLVDGDKLENLAPGSYRLCYGRTTNYEASETVTVTIAAGSKLKVTLPAEQTGYALTADATELDWHGSATLKLTVADGYYATKDLAVKANGETIKPSEQGVYQLSKVEKDTEIAVEGIVKHEPDGTGWKSDGSSHWHVCTCGERIDVAEHTFEWVIDEKPTVERPGSKHLHCTVCDYNSSEKVVIPAASVAGYSGEYDGKVHTADVSALPEGTAVQYSIDGGVNWSATVPEIKNVGALPFKYSATVDGAAIEGEAELMVTPRKVTVTASDASKTYGDDDPALGWKVTEGKLVEGESLEGITVSREAGETVSKGDYAVTASQSEGANPNYEITFKPGTFTIDKRELTVKWDATTEFTYDGEEHCPQADLGNVVGDDKLGAYVDGGAVKAGKHTATITELTGADKGNYKLPATGLTCEFTIKKAPKGAPVVQGVAETVSAKADGKITAVDATMEWRAKDSGEYQAVPEGVAELSGLAAGTYEVRYRADDNHEASAATKVTVAAGRKLVVTLPVEQVGYKLTTDATELDWHGSATLAISIEDGYFADPSAYVVKVNEDAVALNDRGEFAVQDVEGDVKVTVEGVRKHEAVKDTWLSDGNTHWHECTCGGKVDEAAHTFTWVVDTPPTATEKGFGHKQCVVCGYELPGEEIPAAAISGYSDEYDGAYHTVNASALPEGATAEYSTDDGKTWSTAAPEIKDAGTLDVAYRVMIGGATVEGQVTLEVKPRAITVTAQNASKTYGEKDPVFEWSVTAGELVKDETLELEIEREDSDDVRDGGYKLQLTQPEGANPNYEITFVDGMFTINQRLLTVTWGTTEFVYDGKEHCPVATLGNVIGKDDLGAFVDGSQTEVGTYTATLAELTGKAAGNYVLPADGLTCEFSIKNAAQDAPVVQATAETVSGKKDGKITGIDATMEWRAQGAAEYRAVGKDVTELKDLAAGVYELRYQAKTNYDASAATEVTVKAGRKLVVTLPGNQVGYTLTSTATELDWHGSAKLAISIDSAYFTGKDYAVNVNGKAVKLSDDGTYELKDVEGDVNVTVNGVLKHEPDGSGWAHDAKAHWHICRCGEILDKAEHTFEWVVDKPATTEAKGERHQECTACGEKGKTEDIAILAPTIIEGAGQAITVDTAKDLSFRSSAPIKYFKTVLVDDMEVGADNFVLTSGSTIVTLKTSFVKTLGVGEHKLSVVSTTGTAETTFTIAEAAKPMPTPGLSQTTTTTTTTSSKSKKKTGKGTLPSVGDGTYAMAGGVLVAGVAVLLLAYAMRRRA